MGQIQFKTCGRCGYAFVPADYTHCPKCNAPYRRFSTAKLGLLTFISATTFAAIVYAVITLLPHISISIR